MLLNCKTIIMMTTMLLLIPQVLPISPGTILRIDKYLKRTNTVLKFAKKLYKFIPDIKSIEGVTKEIEDNNRIMYSKAIEMGEQIENIESDLNFMNKYIAKGIMSVINTINKDLTLNQVLDDIDFIGRMHGLMQRYLNRELIQIIKGVRINDRLLSETSVEDFASTIVSLSSRSVFMRNDRLCHRVLGTMASSSIRLANGGIYRQLMYFYKKGFFKNYSTANELVFSLFILIYISQVKAQTLILLSWQILKMYKKGSFEAESQMLTEEYVIFLEKHIEEVLSVLSTATNVYLKPDPDSYSRENYDEVTKALPTRIILNEADISRSNTCWHHCEAYRNTWQYRCYDYNSDQCKQQPRCLGQVTYCRYVGDSSGTVCSPPRWHHRRYYYVNFNEKMGRWQNGCNERRIRFWYRWFVRCDYCWCFCDDSVDSDAHRHFNKKPVTSDIKNNKVITGVHLKRVGNVFHIQIQQGQLTEQHGINFSTIAWQDDIAKSGEDYHSVTSSSTTVNLDDVTLPEGYFLTGIKFTTVEGNLQLAIRGTKYGNGLKLSNESVWFNETPVKNRKSIHVGANLPTYYHDNKQISENRSKLNFRTSGSEYDAEQIVLPFIDTQKLAPITPFPLSGVGIYHRTRLESGGFLALKVFTYNTSREVESLPIMAAELSDDLTESITIKTISSGRKKAKT